MVKDKFNDVPPPKDGFGALVRVIGIVAILGLIAFAVVKGGYFNERPAAQAPTEQAG